MGHRTTAQLEAWAQESTPAPTTAGTLELVLRRPLPGEREVLDVAELTVDDGVVGDGWRHRGSRRTVDGSAHPDMQLNVMNARFARFIAVDPDRMALAGDQLYIDLDLSEANVPTGTRLAIGSAVIEATDQPHTGCPKFKERFGFDALRFVNSAIGKELRLRGLNARVVVEGTIRPGDVVTKHPVRQHA
ncbi:MAG: MOSC domain-containing protein [Acidimicrobiales bacterium]